MFQNIFCMNEFDILIKMNILKNTSLLYTLAMNNISLQKMENILK